MGRRYKQIVTERAMHAPSMGLALGLSLEGTSGQGDAARVMRPGRCGQGDAAGTMRLGQFGKDGAARALRPGYCGQGDTARGARAGSVGDSSSRWPVELGRLEPARAPGRSSMRATAKLDKPFTPTSLLMYIFISTYLFMYLSLKCSSVAPIRVV